MTIRVVSATDGKPLAGASVWQSDIDGTKLPGAWTDIADEDGYISLIDSPSIEYYTFSYTGMQPKTERKGEVPSVVALDERVDTWLDPVTVSPQQTGGGQAVAPETNPWVIAVIAIAAIAIIGGVIIYARNKYA